VKGVEDYFNININDALKYIQNDEMKTAFHSYRREISRAILKYWAAYSHTSDCRMITRGGPRKGWRIITFYQKLGISGNNTTVSEGRITHADFQLNTDGIEWINPSTGIVDFWVLRNLINNDMQATVKYIESVAFGENLFNEHTFRSIEKQIKDIEWKIESLDEQRIKREIFEGVEKFQEVWKIDDEDEKIEEAHESIENLLSVIKIVASKVR
jgi:hypothetical protein